MTFTPDWKLTQEQRVVVALTLALSKHIPGYPGATDEQLEAVAREVLAKIGRIAELEAENKRLRHAIKNADRRLDDIGNVPLGTASAAIAEAHLHLKAALSQEEKP